MLKPAFSPVRFKEIIAIFIKYGFEDVLRYLKLPGKHTANKLSTVPEGMTPYQRIRMAFEELGPTFVKFGQIMSLRSDLFPQKMQRGELRVRFEHHNLRELRHTLEKTFSRLTLGIISAAMIISSSLILINEVPPMMAGYSMLGMVGYLLAGLISLWVVYDILRNL